MPIQVSQIAVGKCYETANKQQRRVWEIRAGKVYYFSRGGGHPWQPGHTLASPPSLKSFAAAVDAIIPCPDLDVPPTPTLNPESPSDVFAAVDNAVDAAIGQGEDMILLNQDLWAAFLTELDAKPETVFGDEQIVYRGINIRESATS